MTTRWMKPSEVAEAGLEGIFVVFNPHEPRRGINEVVEVRSAGEVGPWSTHEDIRAWGDQYRLLGPLPNILTEVTGEEP
jgi:hypothetical protein